MRADLRVDFPRLRADIEALSQIGRGQRGITRRAFTDADMLARAWLERRIREAGLEHYQDGAANVHARLGFDGATPSVMIGSHIDTVPHGGHLDGALGVLVGLECLRRFAELEIPLARPLECVAFTDEEGRFGGLMGSQAVAGLLVPSDIEQARDFEGVSLVEAMAARDLDATQMLHARRSPGSIDAYVELHIEQGPVLEHHGVTIGVVTDITGLLKWEVRMIGAPNHAGTTPMELRKDAFRGLAEFAAGIPGLLDAHGSHLSRATIGRIELEPGAANIVPGRAICSLDLRDPDPVVLRRIGHEMERALAASAERHGLGFEFDVQATIEPVTCDVRTRQIIARHADRLGLSKLELPSGAAHDAQNIAKIARVGMIFVPSQGGRSHSEAEWTAWEDVEAGANVTLGVLAELAG